MTRYKIGCLIFTICFSLHIFASFSIVGAAAVSPGVSVPFTSLSSDEQNLFWQAVEYFVKSILGYDTSPEISYTMPDGTVIRGTKSEIMDEIKSRANQQYIEALQDSDGTTLQYIFENPDTTKIANVLMDEYCSSVHYSPSGEAHGGTGKHRVDASSYDKAVNDFLGNTVCTQSGLAAGVTLGISAVNGKPQKVINAYSPSTVEVFDYLGFDYVTFDSLSDLRIDYFYGDKSYYYTPYIITTDNTLYTLNQDFYIGDYFTDHYATIVFDSGKYHLRYTGNCYNSLRFYESNGIFCVALYLSALDSTQSLYRKQIIFSTPKLTSYPVLFSDKLSYKKIDETIFSNYDTVPVYFENVTTGYNGDKKKNADIFSLDILQVGYIYSSSNKYIGSLKTAANMLSGTENAVQGGSTTTYTDLSDIEKGIYTLAQQQGISYDEMLKQCNILIDENGQAYIEMIDGVEKSISDLKSEFDKLVQSGNITNENTAATLEQVKAILEYLQGLNIDGMQSSLQEIATAIDGLKESDEDKTAVLGDINTTLNDLKTKLDGLDLDGINAKLNDITQSLNAMQTKLDELSQAYALEKDEIIESMKPPSSIADKFPFSIPFDIYNLFNLFSAEPETPVFDINFDLNPVIDFSYPIHIDLSYFDGIAEIVRYFLEVIFIVLLAIITNKLIGRG